MRWLEAAVSQGVEVLQRISVQDLTPAECCLLGVPQGDANRDLFIYCVSTSLPTQMMLARIERFCPRLLR